MKHEILHALGFSVSLFAFYRDGNGNPLTPREDNGKPRLNEKWVRNVRVLNLIIMHIFYGYMLSIAFYCGVTLPANDIPGFYSRTLVTNSRELSTLELPRQD